MVIIAVVGCFGVIFVGGILAALILPALAGARKASRSVDCRNHLKQIYVYVELYEGRFQSYPDTLRDIWRPDMATDPNLFVCAAQGKPLNPPAGKTWTWEHFAGLVTVDYRKPAFSPAPGTLRDSDAVLLAWERSPHADGRRNVVYLSGRTATLDEVTFQAALKAQR